MAELPSLARASQATGPRQLLLSRAQAPDLGPAPGIPGVDANIGRKDLRYDALVEAVRRQNWVCAKRKRRRSPLKKKTQLDDQSQSTAFSTSTGIQIEQIKRCCDFIDQTFGDGDGEISLPELEAAFRRMRRERAAVRLRERGRALGRRLAVLLRRRGHDCDSFVKKVDSGSKDGKLTPVELERGIRKYVDEDKQMVSHQALHASGSADLGLDSTSRAVIQQHRREMRDRIKDDAVALITLEQAAVLDDSFGVSDATTQNLEGKITFGQQDISDLIRFLDPSADGDVSALELQAGLDLAQALPPQQSFVDDAFVLMNKFEASMKKKAQTVVRLFHEIDADRSGKLDIRELGVALDMLAGPSARERALKKLAEKRDRQERERQRKEEADRLALQARKAKAEAAGVPRVLGQIDAILKQKDLRIVDLVSGFDASSDGLLDATELQNALAKAGLKLNRTEAKAVVEYLDDDGSGDVDAKELEQALRRWRRDYSDENRQKPVHTQSNYALLAARAAQARQHQKSLSEPADGFDPIALCFSYDWLPTLDTFLAKRTGPQDEHARRAVAKEALRVKRERRQAEFEASVGAG